jgi:hypothetical protein
MWRWLGKLTDQQRSLIEERLKYTDKELAKQGLKPGFRREEIRQWLHPLTLIAPSKAI